MSIFRHFLTEFSARKHPYFHFRTIALVNSWIFTKFDMCIDAVEIWFGIAHWQISSILTEFCFVCLYIVYIVLFYLNAIFFIAIAVEKLRFK